VASATAHGLFRAGHSASIQHEHQPPKTHIQTVTQDFGTGILLMKDIIAMMDDDQRFVVQAVHMLLEGGSQRPWKSDEGI
jgi:G3E family GTPase